MSVVIKPCYHDTGLPAKDDIPCDPRSTSSACCGPGSICSENFFCVSASGANIPGSCTDQQWGAHATPTPGCPCRALFRSDNLSALNFADSVTTCSDGTLCCGFHNSLCCDQGNGMQRILYNNPAVVPNGTAGLTAYYSALNVTLVPVVRRGNGVGQWFNDMPWPGRVGLGVGLGVTALLFLAALLFLVATWKRYNRLKMLARGDGEGDVGQGVKGMVVAGFVSRPEEMVQVERYRPPSDHVDLIPAPLRFNVKMKDSNVF